MLKFSLTLNTFLVVTLVAVYRPRANLIIANFARRQQLAARRAKRPPPRLSRRTSSYLPARDLRIDVEPTRFDVPMDVFEPVISDQLEAEVVAALTALLGSGEPLTSFPLPPFEVDPSRGRPAGTVMIEIETEVVPGADVRQGGNTAVYGRIR